jgi:hypothetical protein
MLHLEIGSPKLDLARPIFHARPHVRVLAICIQKLASDSLKFETFEVQELDNMVLLQLHPGETFQFFTICIAEVPAISSRPNPKLLQHLSIPRGY